MQGLFVAREGCGPLAGPADRQDEAAAGPLEVHEGQDAVGAASALRGEGLGGAGVYVGQEG